MAVIYYPSIGLDGWVSEVSKKLDSTLADFYTAEYSQDYVFAGSITSLPDILQKNNGDLDESAIQIRRQLQPYLEKYFEYVYLECSPIPSDDELMGVLSIFLEVTDNGETMRLRNLLRISGTHLAEVMKILA